jgi:abortive infection bacteriophage resistance protein
LAAFFRLLFLINMPAPSLQPFTKPALSYAQQVQKLRDNGMAIRDEQAATQKLAAVSYYRLSGYWHPLRLRDVTGQVQDQFELGTTFETVLTLYEFDQKLRTLVLSALEQIEVAIRTQFTYVLAHRYGALGYADAANFHAGFHHSDWLTKLTDEVTRSKDMFLAHYKGKYAGYPIVPIWMLTEVMSLGSLSQGYKGLRNNKGQGLEDKKSIAQHFGLHHKRLAEWLHTFTYVRNICAHHSRLWNRELAIHPDLAKEPEWQAPNTPRNDRIFYVLLMIQHMLRRIGAAGEWTTQIDALLIPICQNQRWQAAMGVPPNWQVHPLWRKP